MIVKFTHESSLFKEGEIELDGLTVICGDNNTGKSCVAYNTYEYLKGNNTCFLMMGSRDSYYSSFRAIDDYHSSKYCSIEEKCPGLLDMLEGMFSGYKYPNVKPCEFSLGKGKFRFSQDFLPDSMNATYPIYQYLKYFSRKGQIFIIDEPELRLHPKNQRTMARLLAKLVNAGIKVLITTNSDYIIREFNTLIMLKAAKGAAEEYGYSKNELLNPAKVKCYVADGGKLIPMNVSSKYGIEVTSFDETIEEVNKVQQALLYALR